jgi:hypothetical protein
MSIDATVKPPSTTAFPKGAVEAKLRDALLESAKSDAAVRGVQLPADPAGQAAASVHLDSLDVVSLLCDVEPIVGFELKDSLVQAGGYSSVNEAMEHLMPQIERAWVKNSKKGGKK